MEFDSFDCSRADRRCGADASAGWASAALREGRDRKSASSPLPAPTRAQGRSESSVSSRTGIHTPRSPGRHLEPKGTFVSATGVADLATGTPLRPDMQFKIASQTKTFTANLVLQLVGEGKVSSTTTSPNGCGVPNGDRITIRQLLSIRAVSRPVSLADGKSSKLPTGCTAEDSWRRRALPPVAAPGAKWSYSNYGYDLLGARRGAGHGPGPEHGLQQRIAPPSASANVPSAGKRPERAVHPRVRDRRGGPTKAPGVLG